MVRTNADARGPRGSTGGRAMRRMALGFVGVVGVAGAVGGLGVRSAGAEPPPGSGETRVCVHVFDDRNGDGVQQLTEEAGLAAWSVRVEGGRPAYLTTGDDGTACTAANAGSRSIQVPAQPGWAPTSRVSLRVVLTGGMTTDVYAGFRKEEAPPGTPSGAPSAEKVAEAPPPGREADLTIGAANPVRCCLTSVYVETAGGTANLVADVAVPLAETALRSADVAEVRLWYEGPGGVPSVAFVTGTGAVVRPEGTVRVLHLCAEVPGHEPYAYTWDAGQERGGPAPSHVRFVPPSAPPTPVPAPR